MRGKGGAFPGERRCAEPGCAEAGDYRAPLDRPQSSFIPPSGPSGWQYFCLAHVREFNARWNYFAGMAEDEIHAAQSSYQTYDNRGTQAFAHNFSAGLGDMADPLGILREQAAPGARPRPPALPAEDRRALAKLGLGENATLSEVKSKYRSLARRYHPDANQGDRRHEAHFLALTEAYRHLRDSSSFSGR